MAKRADSLYEPGKRSGAWVKLPLKQTGKFVLGGYRCIDGIAVLLVGRHEGGKFRFAGKVTQGIRGPAPFRNAAPDHLALKQWLFVDLPNAKADPFGENVTPEEMPLFIWVRPEIELKVAFTERTRIGALRHAQVAGFGL